MVNSVVYFFFKLASDRFWAKCANMSTSLSVIAYAMLACHGKKSVKILQKCEFFSRFFVVLSY